MTITSLAILLLGLFWAFKINWWIVSLFTCLVVSNWWRLHVWLFCCKVYFRGGGGGGGVCIQSIVIPMCACSNEWISAVCISYHLLWQTAMLDLDLDQSVANHPFTGIGATVGGAQFAGTAGSWLLPELIWNCQLTFDERWYRPGGSSQLLSLGSVNGGIGQCVIRGHSSICRCS